MAEIGRSDDGEIDEIIAGSVGFHLEQMSDGVWWIGLTNSDGTIDHLTLYTRRGAAILARFETDA